MMAGRWSWADVWPGSRTITLVLDLRKFQG